MVAGHFINGDYNVVQDGGKGVQDRVKGIQDEQKKFVFSPLTDLALLILHSDEKTQKWMAAPDTSVDYKTARRGM